MKFEKLTLDENVNITIYDEALDYAFESSDIKNVAITGAYGAGKSSVLASYKKTHKDKEYIHISLAHFKDDKNNKGQNDEMALEGKILNQLIHQVPAENIPQTHFKTKQKVTFKSVIFPTIIVMLLLVNAMFIVFHAKWTDLVQSLNSNLAWGLGFTTSKNCVFLSCLMVFALCFYITYQLIKLQKNKRLFKKVNFKGNEIEIFEDKDESYFDKYLNEVLYLFENSNADVIVFEDMDRFEKNRIFERLREINTLINVHLKKEDKIIRFFYLLRDDVFVSKDRTKFFDYIIPVVPVMDGSNSYEQFVMHLQNNDFLSQFDNDFLRGISLYVDDMRVLKNICNEYLIYYKRLDTIELDCNKMFAIITYKNIFPKDFSDLQMGKGYVFSLFSNKEKFIKSEEGNLKKRIDGKNLEIEACEQELLDDKDELEILKNAKKANCMRFPTYSSEYRQAKAEFDEWQSDTYLTRQMAIENKNDKKLSAMREELTELKTLLSKLYSLPLKCIITRENADGIFRNITKNEVGIEETFAEIRGDDYFPLLKYLIWNGYIDETYADYMTYFYDSSLCRTDKIFLRSVKDKKKKEYSYSLKNCELIVSYLNKHEFEQPEALNFDLFTYLIKNRTDSEIWYSLIYQLKETENYDFIVQYFFYNCNMLEYVSILNEFWPSLFSELFKRNVSIDKIREYAIATILSSNDDVIVNVNVDNCLTEYISTLNDFLNMKDVDDERFIYVLNMLNVKFSKIDGRISDEKLLYKVYEHSLYEINYDNIKLMIENFYNEKEYRIKHFDFSIVLLKKQSPIYSYMHDNMEEYVKVVVDNCDELIEDDEDIIIEILNNTDVSNDLKKKIIGIWSNFITKIESVTDSNLWKSIFENDKVYKAEVNIYAYYVQFKAFDTTLINYINGFVTKINMSKAEISGEIASDIFTSCVKAYDIGDKQYRELLSSMNRAYENGFSIDNVPSGKFLILIDNNIIRMTKENLISLRNNYSLFCLHFIKHNVDKYVEIMEDEIFLHDELIKILKCEDISDNIKLKLLTFDQEPISVRDANYGEQVEIHILNNNLDKADIPVLYKDYEQYGLKIKEFIFKYATLHLFTINNSKEKVSASLIVRLLESGELTDSEKIDVFVSQIPYISKEDGKVYSSILSSYHYDAIFDSYKKPKYEINDINTYVLDAFKKVGWIYEYFEDVNKEGYYGIRRNKPANKKELEIKLL